MRVHAPRGRVDGVDADADAMPRRRRRAVSAVALSPRQRHRDAVVTIARDPTRRVDVQRHSRDGVCATQELLDVLHEDVNLIQEKPLPWFQDWIGRF